MIPELLIVGEAATMLGEGRLGFRRMRAALSLFILFALFLSVSLCVLFVHACEPSITEILNNLGYTNVANSAVETFPPGTYNITLYAEFTQYFSSNELSFYQVGDFFGNFTPVLEGSEGGYGCISPLTKSFEVDYQFGLSLSRNDTLPFRYFTESSGNICGKQYAIVYANLNVPGMFLIGFDDRNHCTGGGDFDYNDMVFSLQLQPARTQQYYLQVVSPYGTPSGGGWYDNGTNAFASLTDSIVNYGNGTRRVFTQWSGDASGTSYSKSDPIYMDQNKTATADWEIQYYLTVVSQYATLVGQGWYDSGTAAYATLDVGSVDHSNGTRHVFTSWNGDASGTNYAKSNPITMDGPKTAVADWKIQYRVIFDYSGLDSSASGTVVTVNGRPVTYGQLPYVNWTDSGGSMAYLYGNVSSSIIGKQFILINVTGLSSPTTVTSPIAVTGNYKTQYEVTFNQTGVGFDFTAAVVAVDSNGYAVSSPPVSFWWDNFSSHTFSFLSPLIVNISKQYNWVSTSGLTTLQNGTLTVTGSGSVTGNYAAEYKYQVTFNQTGVNTDFTGTVVTIDGVNYTTTTLPASFWWGINSIHTFAYQSPLIVTPNAKQYVWINTSGLSTMQSESITVTMSGNVTGNYKTQNYLTVASLYDSPIPSSGWFDSGTSITASVTSPTSGPSGTQYVCTGWSGSGSVPASGTTSFMTFTVTQPSSISWNWKTLYQVTFAQTGVGSDFTGTVVTMDGVNYTVAALPASFWWDNFSSHTFSFLSPLIVNISKQYNWVSTSGLTTLESGTLSVTGSGRVTGNCAAEYKYQITFNQIGVSTDFTDTVVTVDGANYSVAALPLLFWWDNNSIHTFAYQSLLVVTANSKQYVWISTSGLSTLQSGTIAVTASGSTSGNYKTQYYLAIATSPPGVVSPSGAGWYDAGTNATVSTVASVDIVPGSSRYRFDGWTTTNMTEIADPTR